MAEKTEQRVPGTPLNWEMRPRRRVGSESVVGMQVTGILPADSIFWGFMKVLIVDDDEAIVDMLKMFCESLQLDVSVAYNGDAALEKFAAVKPDLVLLDVMMPGRDGLSTLIEMRKIAPNTRYVMITAYQDAEKILESYRQGAVDCLLKPINFEYLKGVIQEAKEPVLQHHDLEFD